MSTEATTKVEPGDVEDTVFDGAASETEIQAETTDAQYGVWAKDIVAEAVASKCLTLGVVNGSRHSIGLATLQKLARDAADELAVDHRGRCLLVRFDGQVESVSEVSERIPVAQKSPLGNWSELLLPRSTLEHRAGQTGSFAAWLPQWKQSFQLILVDLGAINTSTSRLGGRLCDGCYLVLGPQLCGSDEWIMQQIAWHHRSGATICGTLLVE